MANRNLNPDQFNMVTETEPGLHSVEAFHPDFQYGMNSVGRMYWEQGSGRISRLEVHPDYERQGIATRMYNHAMNSGLTTPMHDISAARTKKGKRWVNKVGGPSLPEPSGGHWLDKYPAG